MQLRSPARTRRNPRWSSSAARPAWRSAPNNPLLHHRVGAFSTQREVFERITVAATCLDDPLTAFREIDRCLAAAVALQTAGVHRAAARPGRDGAALQDIEPIEEPQSNPAALEEALE